MLWFWNRIKRWKNVTIPQVYSEMWTDIDNYALVEIPDSYKQELSEKFEMTHTIHKKYPFGYREKLIVFPQHEQPIVDKMLKAGVRVLSEKDIADANKPYHLWFERPQDFQDTVSIEARKEILSWSHCWTDLDNSALVERVGNLGKRRSTHIIYRRNPGGYHPTLPTIPQDIIDKMLVAGVKIFTKKEVLDANKPYHLWTDLSHEYLLVGEGYDAVEKILSLHFMEFVGWNEWGAYTWEELIGNMEEAGVGLVSLDESLKMIEQNKM